jgi:hypothetical protein
LCSTLSILTVNFLSYSVWLCNIANTE